VLVVMLAACSSVAVVRPHSPVPVRTCLVLSVGGVDGLAHLGAIQALQQHHQRIDCVYGNSMGAVVGSLYATAPTLDPVQRYRDFLATYGKRAQADWDGKGPLGKVWAVLTGGTPKRMDLQRFEKALDETFFGRPIEDATLPFATSYQLVQGAGVALVRATTGSLAHAVAMSANNPMLFPGTEVRQGTQLDPGADRVARVPVEDACTTFPGARLLVVNVTGEPAFYRPGLACDVIEVRIPPGQASVEAFTGTGPEFEHLVERGREQMSARPPTPTARRD
jgi:predicted acylesterase/phospholipase RssA